ncbi:WecB/TagA/CpsF family glycosyltransferase [Microbacteriaceae bacterium VKM Ac-2855]|nr:WecB/TagA/CpsF family glycosyltransferase [Microbacteriaceae bacterium VKM Ac-2855]
MTLLDSRRITLGGTPVDLYERDEAVALIAEHAARHDGPPLGVLSANVDHLTHFGAGGRWAHVLEEHGGERRDEPSGVRSVDPAAVEGVLAPAGTERTAVQWLHLIDGSPLAVHARRLTGKAWPRLAGSDLIDPIFDHADRLGLRVAVLGGSVDAQDNLRARLAEQRPDLVIAGMWSPDREQLTDDAYNRALAAEIAESSAELLVVGFGKPRQELWINEYGAATGAHVLLAFGAAVDFLGGSVRRAPRWIATHGLEWAWRLALEPRRLARRYLVDGPVAYGRLRMHSALEPNRLAPVHAAAHAVVRPTVTPGSTGTFVIDPDAQAEVAVIIVSFNNADSIDRLLLSLRAEATVTMLRVIVVDNDSTDGTLDLVRRHTDVTAVAAGGNLGYAGGINRARRLAGPEETLLVLNPDLTVSPGAIARMLDRMDGSEAGVVVPLIRSDDGVITRSLRWEPTRLNALGEAILGDRMPERPPWLAETDRTAESYRHAHPIDWATGAALLIDPVVAARIGDWDERFFLYSEEVDFFRRARTLGADIWFEPAAEVVHTGGGSGGPAELAELMAVNRVRYIAKHHSGVYTAGYRAVVTTAEAARGVLPGAVGASHRRAAVAVADERRWRRLPAAVPASVPAGQPSRHPGGSVVIPAFQEQDRIARALAPLAALAADGTIEVVVVCNGCTDRTAEIARGFTGVRVVEIAEASKPVALNVGDAHAGRWPRLYLDADVEMPTESLWSVFSALEHGGLLAARAAVVYDTVGASPLVRAYYRARRRMSAPATALWSGGGYAVSAEGRARFGAFPAVHTDDVFVHGRFTERERGVVGCAPVVVRAPRSARELTLALQRIRRDSTEIADVLAAGGAAAAPTAARTLRELFVTTRTPVQWFDATIYTVFALVARAKPTVESTAVPTAVRTAVRTAVQAGVEPRGARSAREI